MIDDSSYFCIERSLPLKHLRATQEKAIDENPSNASPLEAAANQCRLWKSGRILRVAFLEGWLDVQQKIMSYAQQWSHYANIHFLLSEDPDAEIRIGFNPHDASWSALGTNALVSELYPKQKPTMNFNHLTSLSAEKDFSRAVLHEFGHVLGLIHEHQSPVHNIQWNKEVVIRKLSNPPYNWTLHAIQRDVFDSIQTKTQFSQFDPASIMLYPIPNEWTLNGVSFSLNETLSVIDKQFIHTCYPS